MHRARLALFASFALAVSTVAAQARELPVHKGSEVSYSVKDAMIVGSHFIHGVDTAITGTIAWSDSSKSVRFPSTLSIASGEFHTDIAMRDRRVATLLEKEAHPSIAFTLESADPPLSAPLPVKSTVKGTLEVRGVKKALSIPVTLATADGVVTVSGSVQVDFEDFGLTPPKVPLVAKAINPLTLDVKILVDAP